MTNVDQAIADFYDLARAHKIRAYQIANEAGLTRVTLSNWKSKRNEPTLGAWLLANEALQRLVQQKLDA
jgi:transcriptional regulator with XRE-family HTH domain